MGKEMLSVSKVRALTKVGMHADGDGLYLRVRDGGSKQWKFIVQANKRREEHSLGSASGPSAVSLALAREKAAILRDRRARGELNVKPQPVKTYKQIVDDVIEIRVGHRPEKTQGDWRLTLKTKAAPLMEKPLDKITIDHIADAVRPVMEATPSVGKRMLDRLIVLFDYAVAHKIIRENPIIKDQISFVLPTKTAKPATKHHEAVPYKQLPAVMAKLREQTSAAAQSVEFLTLTAGRHEETRGATWDEIDMDAALWIIPKERMKSKKSEHVVPLTARMLEILEVRRANGIPSSGFVFESDSKAGVPVSWGTMIKVFREALPDNAKEATLHGNRSAFSDRMNDETEHQRETIEECLSHAVGNAVTRAYRRGAALDKRRACLDDWSDFLRGK